MSADTPRRSAPRAPDRTVWIDGELCRGDQATVSVFDRGSRDGEGLFETLRVYGGSPFRWERHLERLVVSAAELGFPVPPSPRALLAGLGQVLESGGLSDAVARVTVTRGVPSGGARRRTRTGSWIEAEPLGARLWSGARTGGATLVCSRRRFEPGPLGRHKTTSRLAYHLAREEARAARADEALLISTAGLALEGAVSNVFSIQRGTVVTPPLSLGILPGIARATVLEQCAALGIPAEERPLSVTDLIRGDGLFVTNSVQEVVAVRWLDGTEVPADPLVARLAAAYSEVVAREVDSVRSLPQLRS